MLFIYLNVAVIIVIQKLFDRKLSEKKKSSKKTRFIVFVLLEVLDVPIEAPACKFDAVGGAIKLYRHALKSHMIIYHEIMLSFALFE